MLLTPTARLDSWIAIVYIYCEAINVCYIVFLLLYTVFLFLVNCRDEFSLNLQSHFFSTHLLWSQGHLPFHVSSFYEYFSSCSSSSHSALRPRLSSWILQHLTRLRSCWWALQRRRAASLLWKEGALSQQPRLLQLPVRAGIYRAYVWSRWAFRKIKKLLLNGREVVRKSTARSLWSWGFLSLTKCAIQMGLVGSSVF